ncbi:MAG: hypothetical protein K940chlam7_00976 [Chlamydiae bacterium]|nr:hypothetical protein [Chlamydiota bacterium]
MTTFDKIGQKYKNFEVKRVVDLPEIRCRLIELEHEPTGAQVMHIDNDDPENVFCLSFQTVPDSSNGVAHVLEHTVLCGSEKFPVKDPFFAMTRRSLNTFMNAFTGADFTCYPAASQVPKDFYNLLEVYLDAVFNPNLKKLSFMQEGHRLEFETPTDSSSPLEYKGIVFNEMKGAMSTPDSRMNEAVDEALFPEITYGFNSGGDPKIIPELTYQQLLDFHAKYYHPSRCLFFFYGNIPLEKHLDFIEKHALKGIEKKEPLPLIPKQPKFSKPKKNVIGYPFAAEEDPNERSLITFSWLTCHILEQEELLALSILCIVLLSTDASPLKKVLLKSGFCKQVSAHLSDDMSEIPLLITLRGCNAENVEVLEQVILNTLNEIYKNGVPEDLIENAIHQVEFHRSEIAGDSYPYGLSLFLRAGLLKQHGGKPEDILMVHSLCNQLRKRFREDKTYLTSLIQKHLLFNRHFVCVVAKPDKELALKEMEEEKKTLEKKQKGLNEKQKNEIVEKTQELARFQEEQEHVNLDVLPKVTLDDVSKHSVDYPLTAENAGNLKIYRHSCFTNGIVYANLVFPIPAIEEKDLPLLNLFTICMPQMGCGGRSYAENLEYIQANTGGVGTSKTINVQAHDFNTFYPYFNVQSKALYRNVDKLFPLLQDMVSSTNFTDLPRLKEVIVKHFTALESTLNQYALRYAMNLAASGISMSARVGNAWGGLEYYYFAKKIVENFDDQAKNLVEQLQKLQKQVLCLEEPHLVITCDNAMYDTLKQEKFFGLQEITTKPYQPWKSTYSLPEVPLQGRIIASPVAFTSKIFKTLSYAHEDTPALNVAAHLFDNLTLHPRIREQGGAYGGGAANHALVGNFAFYAYRDPNISSTLSAFEEAVEKVINDDFKDSDLGEAKLEIIQGLDSPTSPGSRGNVAYGWLREGKTLEMRQTFRDRLLSLTRKDVVDAVKNHIQEQADSGCTVVFAGKELLEKENDVLISQGKEPLQILSV